MSMAEINISDRKDHIQHCVLDSGPIIKGLTNFYTKISVDKYYAVPDVMREIRDAQSRLQLSQLPFELIIKQPTEEALAAGNFIYFQQ
jgi:RNA-binding protein NOB1